MRGLTSKSIDAKALAAAVILRAIKDYLNLGLGSTAGNKHHSLIRDDAKRFLSDKNLLLPWAILAGIDAGSVSKIVTYKGHRKTALVKRVKSLLGGR